MEPAKEQVVQLDESTINTITFESGIGKIITKNNSIVTTIVGGTMEKQ